MTDNKHALPWASMAEQVKLELLLRITHGELPPGTRLVELRIAGDLDTSQGPVHEALRELEAMDLVCATSEYCSRILRGGMTPWEARRVAIAKIGGVAVRPRAVWWRPLALGRRGAFNG